MTPRSLHPQAIEILLRGTQAERIYLCSLDPKYFAIYYFSEYFDYKFADFHYDILFDIMRLMSGEIDEALEIGFRECAKTSLAKIAFICWAICFKKRKFINVDSFDKENAEAILFDVVVSLQTNQLLINDFGQLYYRKASAIKGDEEDPGAKQKRLSSFITENDIKCAAYSTQESTRGRLYKNQRPDCYLIDDIENSKTMDSQAHIASIKRHIDELRSGKSKDACILYLGNLLTESGVVAYVRDILASNPLRSVVREIPVIDDQGRITWPDKYVKTDAELGEANKMITDPKRRKISLETKRRELTPPVFEREMMNNPSKAGDYFFDRAKVKAAMALARDPIKKIGGFYIFEEYNPMHVYGIGADTSEGVGRDSNASAAINFKAHPNVVVGTFADNTIPPNVFAWELKNEGEYFGECIVCAEMNNTGFATNAELQNIYPNIYQREAKHKITGQVMNEYGWRTTLGTKYHVAGNFKSAFEDGDLLIFDIRLLTEMYHFKKSDLNILRAMEGMTRHFDLLSGAFIAYEMRNNVTIPPDDPKKSKFKSKQKPYESGL